MLTPITEDMEICPKLAAMIAEARGWIADFWLDGADALAALTSQQVIDGINRYYFPGGWDAFVLDTLPITVARVCDHGYAHGEPHATTNPELCSHQT